MAGLKDDSSGRRFKPDRKPLKRHTGAELQITGRIEQALRCRFNIRQIRKISRQAIHRPQSVA